MSVAGLEKVICFLLPEIQKGVRLYADLSTDIHNFHIFCLCVMIFFTVSGNGCLLMVLKGFFANINMKPKNPMDSSGVVVELAME